MPPKPAGKAGKAGKADPLDALCEMVEKRKLKSETLLVKAKEFRSLILMMEADSELDKAFEMLANHGKIPPKIKKNRILPLTNSLDVVRNAIKEARVSEQELSASERYNAWLLREGAQIVEEQASFLPLTERKIEAHKIERQRWQEEDDWALILQCSHLPDANSESDLNDYLTDWENDMSELSMQKAVQESGAAVRVMQKLQQKLHSLRLDAQKIVQANEEARLADAVRSKLNALAATAEDEEENTPTAGIPTNPQEVDDLGGGSRGGERAKQKWARQQHGMRQDTEVQR